MRKLIIILIILAIGFIAGKYSRSTQSVDDFQNHSEIKEND